MKRHGAHWHILAALIFATLAALALRGVFSNAAEGSQAATVVHGVLETSKFVGDLFMRSLKMIIVPLIVTSVIAGIAGLGGIEGFGRLGAKVLTRRRSG